IRRIYRYGRHAYMCDSRIGREPSLPTVHRLVDAITLNTPPSYSCIYELRHSRRYLERANAERRQTRASSTPVYGTIGAFIHLRLLPTDATNARVYYAGIRRINGNRRNIVRHHANAGGPPGTTPVISPKHTSLSAACVDCAWRHRIDSQ